MPRSAACRSDRLRDRGITDRRDGPAADASPRNKRLATPLTSSYFPALASSKFIRSGPSGNIDDGILRAHEMIEQQIAPALHRCERPWLTVEDAIQPEFAHAGRLPVIVRIALPAPQTST